MAEVTVEAFDSEKQTPIRGAHVLHCEAPLGAEEQSRVHGADSWIALRGAKSAARNDGQRLLKVRVSNPPDCIEYVGAGLRSPVRENSREWSRVVDGSVG
jgi:hypothetical protein